MYNNARDPNSRPSGPSFSKPSLSPASAPPLQRIVAGCCGDQENATHCLASTYISLHDTSCDVKIIYDTNILCGVVYDESEHVWISSSSGHWLVTSKRLFPSSIPWWWFSAMKICCELKLSQENLSWHWNWRCGIDNENTTQATTNTSATIAITWI